MPSRNPGDMVILYTTEMEKFAHGVLEYLKTRLEEHYREEFVRDNTGEIILHEHGNHEIEPEVIIPTIRKRSAFVFHGFHGYDGNSYDPNIGFAKLYAIDDTLRRMEPSEITYVMPHIPYQRQDYMEKPHVPITARRFLRMIYDPELPVTTRIVTFNAHSKQYPGYANTFFENLKTMSLHEEFVKSNNLFENATVLATDTAIAGEARKFAGRLGVPWVVGDKIRPGASQVDVYDVIGKEQIKDRVILAYDDMIDTFSTGISMVKTLKEAGAKEVYELATHGIFSTKNSIHAEDNIRESGIKKVIITNSIKRDEKYLEENKDWLEVLSLEPKVANLLYKIQRGEPVSSVYDDHDKS